MANGLAPTREQFLEQQAAAGLGTGQLSNLVNQQFSGQSLTPQELSGFVARRAELGAQGGAQTVATDRGVADLPPERDISMTIESGDLTGTTPSQFLNLGAAPPPVQSLQDVLSQTRQFFQPLSEERRAAIRGGVEAQFAPQFAEQERVNKLRETMERAAAAQGQQTGFGAGRLSREGRSNVLQAGVDAVNRLRRLQEAEVAAQTAAAEGKTLKEQQDFLQLANQFRQQQIDETQQFFQNQLAVGREQRLAGESNFQRAASQLDMLSELGPEALGQFGVGSFQELESNLGLPQGFVDGLQQTKQAAATAETQEDLVDIFNQGARLATSLAKGQTFELKTPDGGLISFVGTKPDSFQVINNKTGIFRVNKDTGTVEQIHAFPQTASTTLGSQEDNTVTSLITSVLATEGDDNFVNTEAYRQARSEVARISEDAVKDFEDRLPAERFLNPNDPTAQPLIGTRSQVFNIGKKDGGLTGGGLDALIDQKINNITG